jgi:WD40 repeat protein
MDVHRGRAGFLGPHIPPDCLAALAAPIRGVPKDAIIGEHLREHRRTMRLARGAVAVLSVLLLLAVAATVTAVGQRDSARTQATIATSRELAALAVANVTTHADVAQLLAVAAFRENDNPQTEGALLQAVAASPHLVRLSRPTGVSIPDAGTVGTSPTLAFSPDGRWLAIVGGMDDGNASLHLNEARPTLMASSTGTGAGLPLWQGDRLLFLGAGAGHLRLTGGNGAVVGSWKVSAGYAGSPTARLLPGGTALAAVDSDGGIGVYDLGTGRTRQVYPDQSATAASTLVLWQADIRPDGGAAVLTEWSSDTYTSPPEPLKVVYVDLRTGASHVVGSGGPEAAVFAGQRLLVQRRTGTLEIWDPAGAHLLQTVPGPAGFTPTLAVSPDGSLLARLTEDGTASVTDLATGTVLATFTLPAPADSTATDPWSATTLAFAPDGQSLLSATSGGELVRWTVASAALIQSACATAGRNLTAAEWKEYVQPAPPSDLSCVGAGHQ